MTTTTFNFLSETVIRRKLNKVLKEVDGYIKPEPLDATEIHQLRRNMKKLRAWIRLLREHSGVSKLNKSDRLLRNFANNYSAARDAHVGVQTLQWLQDSANTSPENAANADFTASSALLQKLVPAADFLQDQESSTKVLDVFQQLADSVSVASDAEILRQGLRKTWRKSRRLYRVAKEDPTAENLHRFRRWVKYLGNQFELTLVLGTSGPVRQMHKNLVSLASQLGHYHDIVVLWDKLPILKKAQQASAEALLQELGQIEQLALKAGLELLLESMNLAELCFSQTPASFTSGLKEKR